MGPLRRDALAAAAQIVLAVEHVCTHGAPERGLEHDATQGLVCTVGSLTAAPGQTNVIAGKGALTVDVRCASDAQRRAALRAIESAIEEVCASRDVRCAVKVTHDAGAVRSDDSVVRGLSRALQESAREWDEVLAATATAAGSTALLVAKDGGAGGALSAMIGRAVAWARGLFDLGGAKNGGEAATAAAAAAAATTTAGGDALPPSPSPPPVLLSGAGHDAMAMAEVAPVGMVFVRCRDGVSHNPAEYAAPEDVARATHALFAYFRRELLQGEEGGGCGCGGGGGKAEL
jgi:acetylornithine deacetylase/succinyl-diaminopimelate desuccinylase-like protein